MLYGYRASNPHSKLAAFLTLSMPDVLPTHNWCARACNANIMDVSVILNVSAKLTKKRFEAYNAAGSS
tara:strand:+ start:1106 stop:1309 length:204 start_codon:yes stop_codon:yes gene_type:complete